MNKQVWSQPQISELSLKMTEDIPIPEGKRYANVDIINVGNGTTHAPSRPLM